MSTYTQQAAHHVADDRRSEAVIVGASIAGLTSALALSHIERQVTLLERASAAPRSGAAVGVDEAKLARITGLPRLATRSTHRRGSRGMHAWSDVHDRLTRAAHADPRIDLVHDAPVRDVGQDDQAAWAVTADGRTFRGEIVVGADGHRSIVRAAVAPDQPDATYAGYLIWVGLTDETAIAPHRYPRDVVMLGGYDTVFFGYPLPADVRPRRVGWAWYDATRNALLRDTGCIVDGVVRHSLRAADVPRATLRELTDEARQFPALWRDAIVASLNRGDFVGTPIAEYVPDRLVNGRLALVGNAAHVPTPMTGSGVSSSFDDAEALADALPSGDVVGALRRYEHGRLASARRLVQSGQHFSRSFAAQAA